VGARLGPPSGPSQAPADRATVAAQTVARFPPGATSVRIPFRGSALSMPLLCNHFYVGLVQLFGLSASLTSSGLSLPTAAAPRPTPLAGRTRCTGWCPAHVVLNEGASSPGLRAVMIADQWTLMPPATSRTTCSA